MEAENSILLDLNAQHEEHILALKKEAEEAARLKNVVADLKAPNVLALVLVRARPWPCLSVREVHVCQHFGLSLL